MDLSQELHKAIKASDVQRVTSLLQSKNVNLRAVKNRNLLCLALSLNNNTKIIELLIRAGADLNFRDHSYSTDGSILHKLIIKAFQQANNIPPNADAANEYTRLAVLAIEHGADINALDDYDDDSVFERAVECNSIVVMKELFKRGACMNQENFVYTTWTAIHGPNAIEALTMIICLNNPSAHVRSERALRAAALTLQSLIYDFDVFRKLLKLTEDPDQPDQYGDTLLYHAARLGRVDAVTVLLDRGVNVNKKTDGGELPLFMAAKLDNTEVTELLISRGASIHDQNDDGEYPIHGACSGKTVDNLICLLRHGASVNVKDNAGKYPLHIAASNDCLEIMLLLLSSGSPINVTDNEGNSPFPQRRDSEKSCMCNVAFIMQYALVQITTGAVNEKDLTIIQANPSMLKCYEDYRNQVQFMKETMVFENTTLLSLFGKNTFQLSSYWSNTDFAGAVIECINENRAKFSTYIIPLVTTLRIAKTKHNIIQNMKNILVESFPVAISDLAIEKITHYVVYDELICSEFDEYLSFYKRKNEDLTSAVNDLKITT